MIALPLGIPWFSAILLALLDGRRRWVSGLSLLALASTFAASCVLASRVFTEGTVTMSTGGWPVGISITLRADPLGVFFLVLANGLLLLALIYEALGGVEEQTFPALILFLATGLNGLFLTGDAFNFYVFFEVAMTASFVLAAYGQNPQHIRSALIFTVLNLLGSALFLTGVVALYHVTGTLDMIEIARWVDQAEPASVLPAATVIFVAFSLKLGLFPFHFWLPPVYRGVQPVVAAVLAGVLANIGSYGLLRFGAGILAREVEFAALALLILGVSSALYGATLATTRPTAREMLAYSSISQAGYILIGLAVGGPVGLTAAVLMAAVNALNKTMLFLADGIHGWLVGAAFVFGAFSVAGIPPSAGFFGKTALFQAGVAVESPLLLALLFVAAGLAFVYMFRNYQSRFWASEGKSESRLAQRLLVLALALLIIGLGVWPEPLLAAARQAAATVGGMP